MLIDVLKLVTERKMSSIYMLANELKTSAKMIEEVLEQLANRGYLVYNFSVKKHKACGGCNGCEPPQGINFRFWEITEEGRKIVDATKG
ncbi:MAG: FeoC-like transcriptional regulator [Alkaliphilus sp.]